MSVFALIAIAALLFWVNPRTRRQPAKALTYHGAWACLIVAVVMIFLGVPTTGALL